MLPLLTKGYDYVPSPLRTCYAMSGTDTAYGATRNDGACTVEAKVRNVQAAGAGWCCLWSQCAAVYGCSAAVYGCSAAVYGCSAAVYGCIVLLFMAMLLPLARMLSPLRGCLLARSHW
eukprot:174041-Rhodomonas_salina.1